MKKLLSDMRSSPATTPTSKQGSTNGQSKKERKMSKKINKKMAKSGSTASSTSIAIAELPTLIALASEGFKVDLYLLSSIKVFKFYTWLSKGCN